MREEILLPPALRIGRAIHTSRHFEIAVALSHFIIATMSAASSRGLSRKEAPDSRRFVAYDFYDYLFRHDFRTPLRLRFDMPSDADDASATMPISAEFRLRYDAISRRST